MKNAGMAGAVALVGIGLITIGLSNFANRAEAVPSAVADAGPDEPVIVWFGMLHEYGDDTSAYRLWSDGTIERRYLGFSLGCDFLAEPCQQWVELPPAAGGDGFACRGDINGDRNVDSADLGLLVAQWGQGISCDPQPSYPCFDLNGLNGLNMNIAAR